MTKPRGIEHLVDYLSEFRNEYVVIGGGAAAILMETQGLEFRSTKDIDIVLLTNGSKTLNSHISSYVAAGKYTIKEASEGTSRFYRFRDPKNKEYPEIIEIFASNEQNIILNEGQYIIPIQNDSLAQISAILLDEEYFNIVKNNCIILDNKITIINALANICLKARAYNDLYNRKQKGETVDSKDINKHKKDILRLALTLNGKEEIHLGSKAKADMQFIMDELQLIDDNQYKVLMEKYPGTKKLDLINTLRTVFL